MTETSAPAAESAKPAGKLAPAFDRFCADGPLLGRPRIRLAVHIGALVLAAALLLFTTRRMWNAPPPPRIEMGKDGDPMRFGLALETRKAMFREVAAADPEWRKQAAARFPQAWRREDDRAAMERDHVRTMAARFRVSVTASYLVVDEGIRQKWTAPNGTPLSATVVPLQKK